MTDPSDSPKPATKPELSNPLTSWVRGGTVSSAHEKELQKSRAEAEQRRRQQDEQFRVARENPLEARMHSLRLGGQQSTLMIVLEIQNSDRVAVEWIKCELIVHPEELVLNMACPRCLQRDPQTPNFMIRQSNRRFELDTRRQGEIWVNPTDPTDLVTLAGSINLTEWARCPGLGCEWKFKIENSVLRNF